MGSGIFSANTTIKISSTVNVSTSSSGTTTAFTVAANTYAIFQAVCSTFATSCKITIDSKDACVFAAASTSVALGSGTLYAGPGAVVAIVCGSSCVVQFSGVTFINSP